MVDRQLDHEITCGVVAAHVVGLLQQIVRGDPGGLEAWRRAIGHVRRRLRDESFIEELMRQVVEQPPRWRAEALALIVTMAAVQDEADRALLQSTEATKH